MRYQKTNVRMLVLKRMISLVFIFAFISSFSLNDLKKPHTGRIDPPFLHLTTNWADSVIQKMSLEEKIAQLMMVPAYSNQSNYPDPELTDLIKKYHVGGLIFFQGGPVRQARLTNYYQSVSEVPLLVAMDAEWGLGMRLDSTISYPYQMTLGALRNNELIYEMGRQIAQQMKLLGVHVNFAPVVDINNNPKNPVINYRSFGENKIEVTKKGLTYMHGLQDNHIIASAKHFPGHGDTDQDSHYTLPLIPHSRKHLDTLEMYPFRQLINSGIASVMVAHLHIPSLDTTRQLASTLSEKIIENLLRDTLGFKGLVFTDALSMQGVSQFFKPGELELKALLAGNDILLMPGDVPRAISVIKKAVRKDIISEETINERCLKVLKAKEWVGLSSYKPIDTENLTQKLNNWQNELLSKQIKADALTLLSNQTNIIPIKRPDTLRITTLNIGESKKIPFQKTIDLYYECEHLQVPSTLKFNPNISFPDSINISDYFLLTLHGTSNSPRKNYGIQQTDITFIDQWQHKQKSCLVIFGSPYIASLIKNINHFDAVIICNANDEETQSLAAQAIMGGIPFSGKTPVSVNKAFPVNTGINTSADRLKYSWIPEEAGLNRNILKKIDSIADIAVKQGATPGCEVTVIRNGIVVLNEAYGYHTYLKRKAVNDHDLYDIASLTKIFATVPMLMKLYDEDRIKLKNKLSDYFPELDTTNKGDLRLNEILRHEARLQPWIPFYLSTLENLYTNPSFFDKQYSWAYPYQMSKNNFMSKHNQYKPGLYSKIRNDSMQIKVAEDLYLSDDFLDSIHNGIINSELIEGNGYKYSDLGYYLLKELIEKMDSTSLDSLVMRYFYNPLGAFTLGYLPLEKFDKSRIVPTENDIIFRKQLIHGYVHDPGAAMQGGVGGHAGLFACSNDLGKMMQMYLQGGSYGYTKYFESKTIEEFTVRSSNDHNNRRGLGFDKPPVNGNSGSASKYASKSSFGHTGFTGTIAWADPEEQLIFIFLSNRVHPDQGNAKLIQMDIRSKMHDVIYEGLLQDPDVEKPQLNK